MRYAAMTRDTRNADIGRFTKPSILARCFMRILPNGFRQLQILRCRNFDVHAASRNNRHGLSQALHQLTVIRPHKPRFARLVVRFPNETKPKPLWRLGHPDRITGQRFNDPSIIARLLECIACGHRCKTGTICHRSFQALGQHFRRHKRSDPVVDQDHVIRLPATRRKP